jgi:hypoxanthine phosphoribosyltransferase
VIGLPVLGRGGRVLGKVLDDILKEVRRRTGGPLRDVLALLVAEYRGTA